MLEVLHTLTSPSKVNVFNLIREPSTPENIASELGITRQAVDKHLKDLQKYGAIRKMWLLSSDRPRIQYVATELGLYFYGEIGSFMSSYRSRGKKDAIESLKDLDVSMLNGDISVDEYTSRKERISRDYSWFVSDDE
ncbi:hypothetical protein IX51_10435 [uncultured archaeon]|nr:hypothetical protein IX51_10435 [uncultured archaeon]